MYGTSFKPLKIVSNTTKIINKKTITLNKSEKITVFHIDMKGNIAYSKN
ncbi:hypothetical protein [Heyndrickxia oleronia]